MENSTPTMKLSRQMVLPIVFLGLIGFFGGVLVGVLPCRQCEKIVLMLGEYKVFGEHQRYCPWNDK